MDREPRFKNEKSKYKNKASSSSGGGGEIFPLRGLFRFISPVHCEFTRRGESQRGHIGGGGMEDNGTTREWQVRHTWVCGDELGVEERAQRVRRWPEGQANVCDVSWSN